MSNKWYVVIDIESGAAYSVGTVIADPLPAGLSAIQLSDVDAYRLNSGRSVWDAGSRSLVENLAWTPPPGPPF